MSSKKIILRDDEMPRQWYNVAADIPNGLLPPLDPETREPMGPENLSPCGRILKRECRTRNIEYRSE